MMLRPWRLRYYLYHSKMLYSVIGFVIFVSVAAVDDVCYKDSYPRSIGTLPECTDELENHIGSCLEKCKSGFSALGHMCYSECPEGQADLGFGCAKKDYANVVGWPIWDKAGCEAKHDSCHLNGLTYVPECKSGFSATGPGCAEDCPPNMTDMGLFCSKESYDRESSESAFCGDKEMHHGLCYDACKSGYKGVGPICWQSCPSAFPDDKGAICCNEDCKDTSPVSINIDDKDGLKIDISADKMKKC
eukprot:GHVL01011094.1.p1 GENE.GHVL01011094.1~~GHVL01011094.1.p1  ORF type:complete len:246 (-),score=41.79 GHVL01011094.1:635-1372(-)